jgi:hypothetical protein
LEISLERNWRSDERLLYKHFCGREAILDAPAPRNALAVARSTKPVTHFLPSLLPKWL